MSFHTIETVSAQIIKAIYKYHPFSCRKILRRTFSNIISRIFTIIVKLVGTSANTISLLKFCKGNLLKVFFELMQITFRLFLTSTISLLLLLFNEHFMSFLVMFLPVYFELFIYRLFSSYAKVNVTPYAFKYNCSRLQN